MLMRVTDIHRKNYLLVLIVVEDVKALINLHLQKKRMVVSHQTKVNIFLQ